MEKTNKKNIVGFLYYIHILTFICSPLQCIACTCSFCGSEFIESDFEEPINYEELGQYEDLYREFELELEREEVESEIEAKTFFLKKWCKNTKKWFKKRTVKLLKKFIRLERCSTPDECAYTVVDLKRSIDKKLYNTGSIEILLDNFEKNLPDDPNINFKDDFKERIRYYANNKDAKPKDREYDKYKLCEKCAAYDREKIRNQIDAIPLRALFGGLEVACGCIIGVLPFPGCAYLGSALATHGATNIYEGYMQQLEEEQRKQNRS